METGGRERVDLMSVFRVGKYFHYDFIIDGRRYKGFLSAFLLLSVRLG